MRLLEQKYARLHIVSMVERFGEPEQARLAHDADLLTKERLRCGLTIFEACRMQDYSKLPINQPACRSSCRACARPC